MDSVNLTVPARTFGTTMRRDAWWLQPAAVFLGFSVFVVYATWAAFQGEHYHYGPYLSPFYSPELFGTSPHAWFQGQPSWWPGWLPYSPALLILGGPVGFRFTCYYYRGAYYKAFWADPPNCAVGEPRASYRGEAAFPLILQNVHRYFLYIAIGYIAVLSYDALVSYRFEDPATGAAGFGVGVGSLVLTLNAILLAGYTFGCHSLRHLIGGGIDCLSKAPGRRTAYGCVSCLNRRHMVWAWVSLVWVGFSDLYVRLCSMGVWTDWRLF